MNILRLEANTKITPQPRAKALFAPGTIAEKMLGAVVLSFIGDNSRSRGATGFQNTTED
jgi:hypothetical protein